MGVILNKPTIPDALFVAGDGTNGVKQVSIPSYNTTSGNGAVALNNSFTVGNNTLSANSAIARGTGSTAIGQGLSIGVLSLASGANDYYNTGHKYSGSGTSFTVTITSEQLQAILGFTDIVGLTGRFGIGSNVTTAVITSASWSSSSQLVITTSKDLGTHTNEDFYIYCPPTAIGRSSHVEGKGTIALNDYEHAEGNFNASFKVNTTFGNAGNTLYSIGVGTSPIARINAIEVKQNGDVYVKGIGSYDGTNYSSASTLQSIVNNASGGSSGTLNTNNSTAQTVNSSESLAGTINLHKIAKTGTYSDLIGKPTIPAAPGTLNTTATTAQSTNASEALSGNITLHKVAKTGSYDDLLNKPTIPTTLDQISDGSTRKLSDYIAKTGAVLEDGAQLSITDDETGEYLALLNAYGITAADIDEGGQIQTDAHTPALKIIQGSSNNPTAYAYYGISGIEIKKTGNNTIYTQSFPSKSGTFAMTSDIPSAVTESTVSGWGFTKNSGTITGITMNGASKGTSGVVDLGTVITSETALSKGTTTGSGNAVTDISVNGHQITLTKGSTFLTSETSLSKGTTTGTGNVVTDLSVSGHTVTLTKGSNVPVATSANAGRIPMITSSGT